MSVDTSEAIRELARRFSLPCTLVREAREVFDYYCTLNDDSDTTGATTLLANAASDSAQVASAIQDSTQNDMAICSSAAVLGIKGLGAYYEDMGISFSAVELAELMTSLLAEPAEVQLFRTQEAAQRLQQSAGDETVKGVVMNASVNGTQGAHVTTSQPSIKAAPRGTAKPGGSRFAVAEQGESGARKVVTPAIDATVTAADMVTTCAHKASQGLPFALFLHLMLQQQEQPGVAGFGSTESDPSDRTNSLKEDEENKAEMRAVFRALDHDGDGVLSAEDVCYDVKCLLELDEGNLARDREVLRLARMRPEELHAALRECDSDGDGLVTLADLMSGFGLA